MGGCRCSYQNCKSATKSSGDLHFFHYPVKHGDRCNQWIKNARRPDFYDLPESQLRNKVVCDLHFEPKYFTNILRKRLLHNAIPTITADWDEILKENSSEFKNVPLIPANFANILKERSVHNAVPTITADCDEILNENLSEFKNVQIIPANDDGTLFTVDTDSIQVKSVGKPISTYTLRNGALVPAYFDKQSDTKQVLYTIVEDEIKNEPYCQNNESANLFIDTNKSYEIVSNGNSQETFAQKKYQAQPPTVVEYPKKNNMPKGSSSQNVLEVVYITEYEKQGQSPVIVKTEPSAVTVEAVRPSTATIKSCRIKENIEKKVIKTLPSQITRKQLAKQIKLHHQDIASIKKTLNANMKRSNKFNVNNLKGKIPSTLLGALTVNLNNKKCNFTEDEYNFLTTLYKISPESYSILLDQLHWNLPKPAIIQELLNK